MIDEWNLSKEKRHLRREDNPYICDFGWEGANCHLCWEFEEEDGSLMLQFSVFFSDFRTDLRKRVEVLCLI